MDFLADLPNFTVMLVVAAIALVLFFEFINGFHDTANAVATVIYTKSLPPHVAVLWSGVWNFIGVLVSGGAVAYGIVKLVPLDLLHAPDTATAIATAFAIPLAAIIWNFGTWYIGLPASSSHALIGSLLGVGLAHSVMQGQGLGGVNWGKATEMGLSLLISPMIGFVCAGGLSWLASRYLKGHDLDGSPDVGGTPPRWVRGLLIFTCTGVSFAHGGNDGQKGIGLLLVIMILLVPSMFQAGEAMPDIPLWMKLATAIALGGGTMIGWKRIVVTVGEKIGKSHMKYGQGAAAELTAMVTIHAASALGLPVSTTHVLSSGVAGTMVAQKSGIQSGMVRKILLAWLFTLPATVFLASTLFGGILFILLKLAQ